MNIRYVAAFLYCCILLILSACTGVPPAVQAEPFPASDEPANSLLTTANLHEAIVESGRLVSESLEPDARIAVISITAPDMYEGEYALEELTMFLVMTRKFRIVDRQNLDIIRTEQLFQLSGEVDDETAVSIGHLTGAAFVITGSISPGVNPNDSEKYLRLRVLDVQTGQIHAMTSIVYKGDV